MFYSMVASFKFSKELNMVHFALYSITSLLNNPFFLQKADTNCFNAIHCTKGTCMYGSKFWIACLPLLQLQGSNCLD